MSGVELWTEKYRPKTLDEYVWRDDAQRRQVEDWIGQGSVPHLLFSGLPGVGKTSLSLLILNLLGINKFDILDLNASRDRNVDVVQTKIINFISSWAVGAYNCKYILLDEADSMSPLAQRILRGEMEKYHESARFILTCNYPDKIIPAIHSRCQSFHFQALDRGEFIRRVFEVLTEERIDFDVEIVETLIEQTYPDLRKCINLMQQNCRAGRLERPTQVEAAAKDYLLEMANLFRAGRMLEARKLVVTQAQPEEYPDIFRFMYRNLELWGDSEAEQDEALLVVRRGMLNHQNIADPEINLAATCVELARVKQGRT